MMKKLILICLANVLLHYANGQTFVNNGAMVAVTAGGVMSVRSEPSVTLSGSLENLTAGGQLRNAGTIQIEGDFMNTNGTADGFGTNTGLYRVFGDWSNSATFTADSSTVNLYSSQPQSITSTNGTITTFYNLIDSNGGVKTQTLDANVAGTFTMYDVEHATGDYYLNILNPSPSAIVENSATGNDGILVDFVSSTRDGRLSWTTNQKAEYIFPTGISESGAATIREASVTPPNSTPRTYSIRFAKYANTTNTTSVDLYDTSKKAGDIGEVNDLYYHIVNSGGNTDPADLAIYFNPSTDPVNQSIGRWQSIPAPTQWQDLLACATTADPRTGSPRFKIVKSAWVPTTTDSVYALVDTIAVQADFAFPTAFVGDGNCPTCSGTASGGNNAAFGIINQLNLVTLQQLSVYNRWGEVVFDSKRDGTQDWNGHFNGKLAAQGNYVYRAVVINNATGKQYPLVTGNVALLW